MVETKNFSGAYAFCFLLIACPVENNQPLNEPGGSNFQEEQTDGSQDAGNSEESSNSQDEDGGQVPGSEPEVDAGSDESNPPLTHNDAGTDQADCTYRDIIYIAEAQDANGVCTDACDASTLEFVGRVENPCDHLIQFSTTDSCIVKKWQWQNTGGAAAVIQSREPICTDFAPTHRLEEGDSTEQMSGSITGVTSGTWTLTVTFAPFGDEHLAPIIGEQATTVFTVP